jgi:hypothetical protein
MNLNNLKKDQLIQILKGLKINSPMVPNIQGDHPELNNKNKSIFNQIFQKFSQGIIRLKGFIFKFTLLGIIINLFKKYSFLRKILLFINRIILIIFGISIIDIYSINFISDILEWIRTSQVYIWIKDLLNNKIEIKERTSKLETINKSSESLQRDIENNPRLSEWIKSKEINKTEKINEILTKEEINSLEEKNNKKYYYLAVLFIAGLIFWYYKDEIGLTSREFLKSIRNLWSKPDDDSTNPKSNPGEIISNTSKENIQSRLESMLNKNLTKSELSEKILKGKFKDVFSKEELDNYFMEEADNVDIELIDSTHKKKN